MDTAPPAAKCLQTLTLQDLVWLNLVATKKVNAFEYEKLEQATFRQFGYGGKQDVVGQAAGLLEGVVRLRPFAEGNEATAILGCAAFLELNGIAFRASAEQARALIDGLRNQGVRARDVLVRLTEPDPGWEPVLEPDLRGIVAILAERYVPASPRR